MTWKAITRLLKIQHSVKYCVRGKKLEIVTNRGVSYFRLYVGARVPYRFKTEEQYNKIVGIL